MERYLAAKFAEEPIDPSFHFEKPQNEIIGKPAHLTQESNVVYMGTTLCAIKCKDGIIACSDSRTSTNTFISNEFSEKITTISSNIFSMQCGSAASSQKLVDIAKQEALLFERQYGRPIPVVGVVKRLSLYLNKYHEVLPSSFIIAGNDNKKGSHIYYLRGGAFFPMNVATMGSGSVFIYEAILSFYDENKTIDELKDQMRNAVLHAIHSDTSSGGIVNTVFLKDSEGIVREPSYDGSKRLDFTNASNIAVMNN